MQTRGLVLFTAILFMVQGCYGDRLGVAPSLSQMLAELMQAGKRVTTGVRGGECYVEMDEKRHYFLDDYLDPKNPCRVYICNSAAEKVEIHNITCPNEACASPEDTIYLPGRCCHTCLGVVEPEPPQPKVTEWSEWTWCSVTCGKGHRERTRTCTIPDNALNIGECSGADLLETTECHHEPCFEHCEWEYERCDECTATCGTATKTCYPRVTAIAKFGGQGCPVFAHNRVPQQVQCDDLPQCKLPVDCEWEYGRCGKCSASCGSGTRQCAPIITQEPQHGGKKCPDFVRRRQLRQLECNDISSCQRACPEGYHECTRRNGRKVCLRDAVDTNCECLLESRSRSLDWDGDFVRNDCDNCPKLKNPDQRDADGNGVGDSCEYRGPTSGPNIQEQEMEDTNTKDLVALIMEKLLEIYYSA